MLIAANHYARLITACVLFGVGAIFGTDGIGEITKIKGFFDVMMWIGLVILALYALFLLFLAIYNQVSPTAYKVGDYNKYRDGDFEEWKKKNNIGTGPVDKFIDWFDDPFKIEGK